MAAKAALYAQSLDQARRLSLWTQPHPVDLNGKVITHSLSSGTNGVSGSPESVGAGKEEKEKDKHKDAGMDWTELLRKFLKHNPHREVAAASARTEQTVHTLLSRSAGLARYDHDQSHVNDGSHPNHPFWAPLIRVEDQPVVRTAVESLDNTIRGALGSILDQQNAYIISALAWYSIGEFEIALSDLAKVNRRSPRDQGWERYDWVLSVVCHAVEGFACERLSRSADASRAYTLGSKAYEEAYKSLATGSISTSRPSGLEEVELRNWGEMILFRLSLRSAAASTSSDRGADSANKATLNAHRLYVKHSQFWPITFRPTKAVIVYQSYRQLLHSAYPSQLTASPHQQQRSAPFKTPSALVQCYEDVSAINLAQEKILQISTKLPKAGYTNEKYLNFLDDVAASWRMSGGGKMGAAQVVQIMYHALTHTFQSQRLLRHLARALVADGSYREAGQALKLYLDLFDKTRETGAAQVAKDLRRLRKMSESNSNIKQLALESEKSPGMPVAGGDDEDSHNHDIDSDRDFIRTMVFGSRLFCKYLDDPHTGVKLARRARTIFDEKEDETLKNDRIEESRIEQALGSSLGALTAKDADLETRPLNHQHALQHLENAEALDPNSWDTLYHLSYQLAELRQITPALDRARQAVELNGSSRDAWHLLGLLVAAQKDLGASLQVIETALDDEEVSRQPSTNGTPANLSSQGSLKKADHGVTCLPGSVSEVPITEYAPPIGLSNSRGSPTQVNGNSGNEENPSLSQLDSRLNNLDLSSDKSASNLSPTKIQAKTSDFSYYKNELEVLESEIQIRMTKCVIIEAMEGPEAALQDQQSVLQYFSSTFAALKDVADSRMTGVGSVPSPTLSNAMVGGGGGGGGTVTLSDRSTKRSSVLSRRKSFTNLSNASNSHIASDSTRDFSNGSTLSVNQDNTTWSSSKTTSTPTLESSPKATKLLIDLWLMSAASFRRAGKLDESKGAIQEAEGLNPDDPDVWTQLALHALAVNDIETARLALIKAQSYSLQHIPSIIVLARLYLSQGSNRLPFAEGLLDALTKMHGWDIPEAWFELSRCYKGTGRSQREKECLVWALQLEETRSIRKLQEAVPRWL